MTSIASYPWLGGAWSPEEDVLIEQRTRCLVAARLARHLSETDLVAGLIDEARRYHKTLLSRREHVKVEARGSFRRCGTVSAHRGSSTSEKQPPKSRGASGPVAGHRRIPEWGWSTQDAENT